MEDAVAARTASVAVGDGMLRRDVAVVIAAAMRAVVGVALPAASMAGGGSISTGDLRE